MTRFFLAILLLCCSTLFAQTKTGMGFRVALENNGLVIGGSDQIINGLKLNLVNANYNQVRGINVCAMQFSNTRSGKDIVYGANIGLVALRGNTYGFSLYPMGDFQDEVRGFSGGLINSGNLRSGVSGAIFALKAFEKGIYGVSGSLVYVKSKKIRGFSAAPVIIGDYKDYKEYTLDFRGAALSFFIGSSYFDGLSVSLLNWNREVHGVNIGLLNVSQRMSGLQWGLFNWSLQETGKDFYTYNNFDYKLEKDMNILFQAGLYNQSDQRFTTQFGLVNISSNKYCVQVGLININRANRKGFRVLPFVNFHIQDNETRDERKEARESRRKIKADKKAAYKKLRKEEAERQKKFKRLEKEAKKKRKALK